MHEAAAETILKLGNAYVKKVTEGRAELNIGEVKDIEEVIPESTTEPVDVLARVIAHMAHRLPGLKKIEKRLEGKDLKSGIGSDLAALLVQMYSRNKHLVPIVIEIAQNAQREAAAAKANKATTTPVSPIREVS